MKKRYPTLWRMPVLMLVLVNSLVMFISCGDDEPKSTVIDYYLSVEENLLVDGSKEHATRFENPKTRMMSAIRRVYPTPDVNGNDAVVIAACDQEYAEYVDMYNGMSENLTCVLHLVSATMKDGIIRQNETLKTYIYNINPTED